MAGPKSQKKIVQQRLFKKPQKQQSLQINDLQALDGIVGMAGCIQNALMY
jgi:hypothetical protein